MNRCAECGLGHLGIVPGSKNKWCNQCGRFTKIAVTPDQAPESEPPQRQVTRCYLCDSDGNAPSNVTCYNCKARNWNKEPEPELGRKFDAGKPRYDLLPLLALKEISDVLALGAVKYSPDNWRHVKPLKRRYFRAMVGHAFDWASGERNDQETGKHHLAHAGCCLLFILDHDLGGKAPAGLEE